ncbi:MAG: DNA polymerase I, partial [Defluviitaleaceae bacterium]|nr:DNA polymerase I [Defluviitaleaceae bacterium]
MSKKILLFDGFSILNRAFYALPLFTNTSGEYTNAVYGFINILKRFHDEEKPDFMTVAFDLPQPTFRHIKYAEYKATRKSMPDELRSQVPILKNLLAMMGIPMAQCPGYEADDVIGTLAAVAAAQGISPIIISGDRDMLQLASDTVLIRLPKTKAGKTEVENYYAADVLAKYGVSPEAYIDVKALMGDASDNVPGVPGIGEVTATKIISQYGSLENAIAHASEIKPKRASENLAQYQDQARLSQELVTIKTDAPVELTLAAPDNIWNETVYSEVKRLEMKSLYRHFSKAIAAQHNVPPFEADTTANSEIEIKQTLTAPLPQSYPIIRTREDAAMYFAFISGPAAFYTLWDEGPKMIGMGIALFQGADTAPHGQYLCIGNELSASELLDAARPWLESETPKWALDVKSELGRLRQFGVLPKNISFDAQLAGYVINTLQSQRQAADLALAFLDTVVPTLDDLLDNKGKRGSARKSVADLSA